MDAKERWENIDQMLEEKTKRLVTLPLLDSFVVENNFKGLPTILSRYKFVAKMLEGKKNIVEVGCNAGFKTMLLAQFVENVYGIDYDAEQISFAKENFENKQARFLCKDIFDVKGSVNGIENDGIFALDVIEHIPKEVYIRMGFVLLGLRILQQPLTSRRHQKQHILIYIHMTG